MFLVVHSPSLSLSLNLYIYLYPYPYLYLYLGISRIFDYSLVLGLAFRCHFKLCFLSPRHNKKRKML